MINLRTIFLGFLTLLIVLSTAPVAYASDVDSPAQVAAGIAQARSGASLEVKDYVLDPIVYAIARTAIHSLTRSTVNWINSGFQGSPAFATDLQASLLDAADQEADAFIEQLRTQLAISSPYSQTIASDVMRVYYLSTSADSFFIRNQYNLKEHSPDDEALRRGDLLRGGGISAWIAQTINPQNNQLGAFFLATDELGRRVSSVRQQLEDDVNRGGGFFSWRRCDAEAPATHETNHQSGGGTSLTPRTTCLKSHIETPGSVIASQLNSTIGLGRDSLVQADEIDEIVNALMGQLLNNVLGGSGLAGLSRGSTVSSGRSYFEQTTTATPSTSSSATGTFLQVIDSQTTPLRTYLANWQTINTAALAAKGALQQSSCVSPAAADALIAAEVQPVINQAAEVVGSVPAALNALDRIRSEVLGSASQAVAQQTATLQQVSAEYENLLAGNILPDATALNYAAAQAQDTGVNTPVSLLTRMNQIAAQARCNP